MNDHPPIQNYSRRDFLGKVSACTLTMMIAVSSPLGRLFANILVQDIPNFDYRYKTFSVSHVREVKAWFDELRKKGVLSKNETFQSYIDFPFDPELILPGAKSVVVMSLKQSIGSVTFQTPEKEVRILIPTGYWDDGLPIEKGIALLRKDIFGGKEVAMEWSKLPLKTSAVRSGLAEYGLNNITYVPGYGSYHQLMGFYTTEELPDNWGPLRTMRICKGCSICKKGCPMKCIRDEQFVIDIDHCLTLYNELEDPLPDFLPPEIHHTLVGCLKCQWDCPGNQSSNDRIIELATLNEEETKFILSTDENEKLAKSIADKLKLYPSATVLPYFRRNASLALRNLLKT